MTQIRLGLRENWQQFTLLVVVNVFVGAMVGLERTVVPLLAAEDFGLVSRTVILSFGTILFSFFCARDTAVFPARSRNQRPGAGE